MPHSVFPLTVNGLGETRLSVRADEVDEARRVIEGHRAGGDYDVVQTIPDGMATLETAIGHPFADRGLLLRALTHRSHAHEDLTGATGDNESLEFLGDAVLGMVIADVLFREFPQLDEGRKSKIKSSLVSTTTLARLARAIDLGDHLVLGRGEEKTGGRKKHALLADGFEAVIAAVYLDGGIEAARAFVLRQFAGEIEEVRSPAFWERDYKSALQEALQGRNLPLPEYFVTSETGPDHRKVFEIEVHVEGLAVASASGRSKKEAEQQAARVALEKLGEERSR